MGYKNNCYSFCGAKNPCGGCIYKPTGQDNKTYYQEVRSAIISHTNTLIDKGSDLLRDWQTISNYIKKLENGETKCSNCGLDVHTEIKDGKELCYDCYDGKDNKEYCEWRYTNKDKIAMKGCQDYWEDPFRVKRWAYCPHCKKPIKL